MMGDETALIVAGLALAGTVYEIISNRRKVQAETNKTERDMEHVSVQTSDLVTRMVREQMEKQNEQIKIQDEKINTQNERIAQQETKIECLQEQLESNAREMGRVKLHVRILIEQLKLAYLKLKEHEIQTDPLPEFVDEYDDAY